MNSIGRLNLVYFESLVGSTQDGIRDGNACCVWECWFQIQTLLYISLILSEDMWNDTYMGGSLEVMRFNRVGGNSSRRKLCCS